RAERLVEQQDGWIGCKHSGYFHHLRHSCGELLGIGILKRRKAQPAEELVTHLPPSTSVLALGQKPELDIFADAHPGEDGVFLKDVASLRAGAIDDRAVAPRYALGGPEEAGKNSQEGGFSAAHRAQQSDERAVRHAQIEPRRGLGGRTSTVGIADVDRLEARGG